MSKLLENFTPTVPNVYDANGRNITDKIDYDELKNMFDNGQAFFRKGEKVSVLGPSGEPQDIDAESLSQALNQGYQLNTPSLQYEKAVKEHYTTGTKQAQALGLGALRGLTIGLSDPMLEALGADMEKINALKEYNEAESVIGEIGGTIAPMLFSGGTSLVAKAGVEATEQVAKELGKKTIAQKVLQYSPTNLVNMAGRGIENKITGSIVKNGFDDAAKGFISKSLINSAPKVASQAFEGAIYGLGNALSEASLGDKELNAEYIAGEVGMGSLLGVGFGSALGVAETSIPYVKKAYDSTKKGLKDSATKTISNLFNVNEEVLNEYISKKGTLDLIDPDQNLVSITDQFVQKIDEIKSDFEMAKLTSEDGAARIKQLQNEYKTALDTRKLELQDEIKLIKENSEKELLKLKDDYDADLITYKQYKAEQKKLKDNLTFEIKNKDFDLKAEELKFKDIVKQRVKELDAKIEDEIVESGKYVAEDVQKLHNSVVDKSKQAFESPDINLSGTRVEVNSMLEKANNLAERLEKSQVAENHLIAKNLREEIDQIWKASENGYITGEQAKMYIQDWDKVTNYVKDATIFDKGYNLARKQLRYSLDDSLKTANPSYRELMKEVSSETQLLKKLNRFGNDFESSRALLSINRPDRVAYELAALKELSEKFKDQRNYDYIEKVDRYLKAENKVLELPELKKLNDLKKQRADLAKQKLNVDKTLKEAEITKKIDDLEVKLEEKLAKKKSFERIKGEKFKPAQKELSDIDRRIKTKEYLNAVKDTPEYKEILEAQANYLQKKLDLKNLAGVNSKNVKTLFKRIAERKAAPDEIRKFEKLLDFLQNDPDIPKSDILKRMLEDAGIMQYFDKQFRQGSMNVNKWGAIGALVGSYFESLMGGLAGGTIIGSMVDQAGPKMAKALVDKMASLSAVEKMTMKFAKAQSQRINQFFGTKNLGQLSGETIQPILIQNQDKKEVKKKKNVSSFTFKDSEKTFSKFNEISSNIALLENKLNYETEDIAKYAPAQADAIKVKAFQAAEFLRNKMPKQNNIEYSMKIKTRPSDYEIRKFMKYWEAVDNPLVVFDSLEKGIVMPEQVEVLKTIYPKMYNETLSLITENMAQLQSELPYKKRAALSQFFGVPLDPSFQPETMITLQSQFTPEKKQEMQQVMNQSQPLNQNQAANFKNINLDAKKSQSERIATRGV